MKNNINIYDVLNNLYNLSGLEEIDSDELEGLDFTVDKKRILEIRKNSVKKDKKKKSILIAAVVILLIGIGVMNNKYTNILISQAIEDVKNSFSHLFTIGEDADKYSLKYVKKAKKIGENKIRLDKILLDKNKVYMSFFVELDYNVNLVKEPNFGGICLKINRKKVEDRGLGQTVSLVNNENKKKQLFRIDYEIDLESSIDEKIDSIDFEIQGLEIKEIDKKKLLDAYEKAKNNRKIDYVLAIKDGRGSIKRFDQVLDFSVENMDKVYLRDSTKSYHDEFSIYNGNDKVICRSLSINELGIQADIHYYFDKDNDKGHDLDIIAINDQGDRIRLSPMIGNGQGDSDIRYIMRTMTSQNKDISRFLKSSYIILEAYKVKGEENIKPETFVEELDKDIKYIEDNNAFNNENTSENRDINRNLYSYEKIGQSKKIKL